MSTNLAKNEPADVEYIIAKAEHLLALVKSGIFTINEIRELLGFQPIDGKGK